jgi:hypothetical protein
MRKYRVTLPVEIDGKMYQFGDVVELDLETATQFAHALIAWEGDEDGGNS